MKNKGLISAVTLIIMILLLSFIQEKLGRKNSEEDENRIKTVGVLQYVSHPALDDIYRGIKDGLVEQGYEDGKNIKIEFQNGQADQSKLKTMSQKLINDQSDVLVGIATPAAQSLANSTQEIPIVLGAVSDPEAAGLVKDNDRPGGNITGVSDKSPVDAQLDLAQSLLPNVKAIGVLYSSAEANSVSQSEEVIAEGEKRGLSIKTYPVPTSNDISQVVQVMSEEVDMIYLPTDNVIANATQIVMAIANEKQLPVIPSVDTMIEQGGLVTVGINQYELGLQTGRMTADILSGKSKPATTPIYTFDEGDTLVNTKQAEKLQVAIPKDILENAIIFD